MWKYYKDSKWKISNKLSAIDHQQYSFNQMIILKTGNFKDELYEKLVVIQKIEFLLENYLIYKKRQTGYSLQMQDWEGGTQRKQYEDNYCKIITYIFYF